MNVIISNKFQTLLRGLEIEVIKEMNGVFDVEEIISTFQNFFYSRMILDITAIKDYKDIKKIQKLSISLDMTKVILLLDDSPESKSTEFLSKLISMGIYNFSKNLDDVRYQLETPNTYRDVAHIQQLENITIAEENPIQQPHGTRRGKTITTIVGGQARPQDFGPRIIGIKNLTRQAGSTTLIYLMKKQLQRKYRVTAIEVDKRDFMYFNDRELVSTTNNDVALTISKYSNSEVILLDINNSAAAEMHSNETIYLLEPSILQVNRLMILNSKALLALKNKKVILNKSFLSSKDVTDFSYEAKIKIFANIPPINDRGSDNPKVTELLIDLGFTRMSVDETGKSSKKILGLFG